MRYLIIFSLIFLFRINLCSQDYWQQTNGPYSGTFRTMAIDDSGHIFGGKGNYSNKSVYLSTDNGANWRRIGNALPVKTSLNVIGISDSNHIFIGTRHGIYRSKDHGNNWFPINNGLTADFIYSLAFSDSGYIFAGT